MRYCRKDTEEMLEWKGFKRVETAIAGAGMFEITKTDAHGTERQYVAFTFDHSCKMLMPGSQKYKIYQTSAAHINRYIDQSAEYYGIKFQEGCEK